MSERNTSDYELSRADNNSIFWDRIVPDLLVGASSQEDPQLTIVLAQHGAGKTQLVNRTIVPSFNEFGGVVDIDSDKYKRYHPAYDELMGDGGADMARLTGLDGQRWMRQALQYCRDNRKHTLVQETAQNPPFLVDMIESYKRDSFRVEVVALGVAEVIGRQGVLRRYREQIETSGAGRLPPPEKIEASLKGVLDFAEMADGRPIADRVQVVRRGSLEQTYHNYLKDDGYWSGSPAFRQAIEAERVRRLSDEELEDFMNTHDLLRTFFRGNSRIQSELSRIVTILGQLS